MGARACGASRAVGMGVRIRRVVRVVQQADGCSSGSTVICKSGAGGEFALFVYSLQFWVGVVTLAVLAELVEESGRAVLGRGPYSL